MKLIADLNVNGNQLRDGDKNIGPVENEITPVNQSQIDLRALQNACLVGGKVPAGFTFEEFINALFVKVNPEVATKNKKLPTITVTGELTGTTNNVTVEVGAAAASYTITNTAAEGTYTDGQALTHKITMGKSADSDSYKNIGCTAGDASWNGDSNTNEIVKTVNMTALTNGAEAAEETKKLVVGNITLTKAYAASTLDMSKDGENFVFCSSYGNPLYTEAGQAIPAGSCTATTTNGKEVTIATKFYSWIKGTDDATPKAILGNVNVENKKLTTGGQIIFPANKTLTVSWIDMGLTNTPADSMYTEETKYIALPSDGTATLLATAPADKPYMTYKVYTYNNMLPAAENITVRIQ